MENTSLVKANPMSVDIDSMSDAEIDALYNKVSTADGNQQEASPILSFADNKHDGKITVSEGGVKTVLENQDEEFLVLARKTVISSYDPLTNRAKYTTGEVNNTRVISLVDVDTNDVVYNGPYYDDTKNGGENHKLKVQTQFKTKYAIVLYLMAASDGKVYKSYLRGTKASAFFELQKTNPKLIYLMKQTGTKDEKMGANEYKVPVLEYSREYPDQIDAKKKRLNAEKELMERDMWLKSHGMGLAQQAGEIDDDGTEHTNLDSVVDSITRTTKVDDIVIEEVKNTPVQTEPEPTKDARFDDIINVKPLEQKEAGQTNIDDILSKRRPPRK